MKNVIITLRRRARPYMRHSITHKHSILKITQENLMIYICTYCSRLEEIDRIQIRDINSPKNEILDMERNILQMKKKVG